MTMRRALLIALRCAIAAPSLSLAQPRPAKIPRMGYLDATSRVPTRNRMEALHAALRDPGYVEGRNIVIEYRWAEGQYERLRGLASELVQQKVDVIVAATPPAIHAAQQATTNIPIVMWSSQRTSSCS